MTPELARRIAFTLGALLVYRLGTYIPLPGIDPNVWEQVFRSQASGILGMFNMFAGGSIHRMAIFALNIMPYISASVIIQLLTTVSPQLQALKKEGEAGRKTLNQYPRYLTVLLAALQSYGIAVGLESAGNIVSDPGMFFRLSTAITLTGGTIFLVWLSEQITLRGIGNGLALLTFAGLVAEMPHSFASMIIVTHQGPLSAERASLLAIPWVALVGLVVFVELARRRVPVEFAARNLGGRLLPAQSSHLSLKLNTAGVIPLVFASSLPLLPSTFSSLSAAKGPEWFQWITTQLGHGRPLFLALYLALIVFFAFMYTAFVVDPEHAADSLKKYGGVIPGIEPGEPTAEYLDRVVSYTTCIGSVYLAAIFLIPEILVTHYQSPFYLDGSSVLIMVCTVLDIETQVRGQSLTEPPGGEQG
jgi:preprotein translocase subunit SecY